MKKRTCWIVLALLLVLLLAVGTAGAASKVYSGFTARIGAGETIKMDFPDLSEKIGAGLTKDDFVITYLLEDNYGYIRGTVDENDCLTMEEGLSPGFRMTMDITYTPKVAGVGRTTVFWANVVVYAPLTEIDLESDSVELNTEETAEVEFSITEDALDDLSIGGYDEGIITATLKNTDTNEWMITITPQGTGETDIVITAYNGLTETLHVKVTDPPAKFDILQDEIVCYLGETVPLDYDMGGGSLYNMPTIEMTQNGYSTYEGYYFREWVDWRVFYAKEVGDFEITMTTENGLSDSLKAYVYSKDNCTSLKLKKEGPYLVGKEYEIAAYAGSRYIYPRLAITDGSDVATLTRDHAGAYNCGYLKTHKAGTVTITATNPDGSTVDLVVEVHDSPEEILLNAYELTMEIGDTFDLEVSFDKGTAAYTTSIWGTAEEPSYGMQPARMEGQTIIAQTPGTSKVTVYANGLYAYCEVTVLDGDKRLSIERPAGEFGVQHTWQLRVVDEAGTVYPAKFSVKNPGYMEPVSVTEDGLMTGVREGSSKVHAETEDGRILYFTQEVLQLPTWITHEDVTLRLNVASPSLGAAKSDVGTVSDVTYDIADESVATLSGGFKLLKEGTTEVTVTANKTGVQTTFTLTVLPADDSLYIHANGQVYTANRSYGMSVPCGYSDPLPKVVDYYGNSVYVKWSITKYSTCSSHRYSAGFNLSGSSIKSICASCTCTVTATSNTGSTISVYVSSYHLASNIGFSGSNNTVAVGHTLTRTAIVDMYGSGNYRLGDVTWTVANSSILELVEVDQYNKCATFKGLKPGSTKVTARLRNGVSASFTVEVFIGPGDADENDKVDIHDALLVLQYDAGWNVTINRDNADVNANGVVNVDDAILILRYVAGEDVTLQ